MSPTLHVGAWVYEMTQDQQTPNGSVAMDGVVEAQPGAGEPAGAAVASGEGDQQPGRAAQPPTLSTLPQFLRSGAPNGEMHRVQRALPRLAAAAEAAPPAAAAAPASSPQLERYTALWEQARNPAAPADFQVWTSLLAAAEQLVRSARGGRVCRGGRLRPSGLARPSAARLGGVEDAVGGNPPSIPSGAASPTAAQQGAPGGALQAGSAAADPQAAQRFRTLPLRPTLRAACPSPPAGGPGPGAGGI